LHPITVKSTGHAEHAQFHVSAHIFSIKWDDGLLLLKN